MGRIMLLVVLIALSFATGCDENSSQQSGQVADAIESPPRPGRVVGWVVNADGDNFALLASDVEPSPWSEPEVSVPAPVDPRSERWVCEERYGAIISNIPVDQTTFAAIPPRGQWIANCQS